MADQPLLDELLELARLEGFLQGRDDSLSAKEKARYDDLYSTLVGDLNG